MEAVPAASIDVLLSDRVALETQIGRIKLARTHQGFLIEDWDLPQSPLDQAPSAHVHQDPIDLHLYRAQRIWVMGRANLNSSAKPPPSRRRYSSQVRRAACRILLTHGDEPLAVDAHQPAQLFMRGWRDHARGESDNPVIQLAHDQAVSH